MTLFTTTIYVCIRSMYSSRNKIKYNIIIVVLCTINIIIHIAHAYIFTPVLKPKSEAVSFEK